MELIINKTELEEELDKIERSGQPEFDNPQDEIQWMLKKHEKKQPIKRTEEIQYRITEEDIVRENTTTLLDEIRDIIRIVKRILKGDIYAKTENTNWVIPYDATNDILYVGRMTEREFNSIKKKWSI